MSAPCSSCAAPLPDGARFCPSCGSRADDDPRGAAPAAGPWGDLARYVPPALAERMREAGGRIEGERRLVTVMFADLSGFTAMCERLDPEDVVAITNACLSALVEVVHRHEGTVDKFIGDEIMALFGAPIAHEDDAVRAVRAALDMKLAIERFNAAYAGRLPRPLALHFGLHSGEVVAGNVGHDLRLNYSVMGDTVNLAARLADASEGGQVFCSARTRGLARLAFAFERRPDLVAKGKARPVEVWDAIGPAPAPDADDVALVGREDELAWLLRAWREAAGGRQPPVLVRGPAGMGKSRLVRALATRIEGHAVIVRADGLQQEPYACAAAATRGLLGVAGDDDHALDTAQRFLAGRPFPEGVRDAVLALAGFAAPAGPVGHAERVAGFAALLAAVRRPTALVIEDLPLADASSRRLLDDVAAGWKCAPVLLVATWRDGAVGDPPPFAGLDVGPLSRGAADALANARVPIPLPEEVLALLHDRAAGNPLFVQQLVTGLVESGWLVEGEHGWTVREGRELPLLPEGVTGLVMSRVDRLEHSAREALRHAAVIGTELPRWLVGVVAGPRA